jgi:hypothetical protein
MKIYKYCDTANEYVGFVFHELKKQIIYMRWESPEPEKFVFGKFDSMEIFTPESDPYDTFDSMEQEILVGDPDYGKYIDIEKGDEHLIIKGLFGAG